MSTQFYGIWEKLVMDYVNNNYVNPKKQIIPKEVIEKYTETIDFEEVTETKQLQ